MNNLVLYETQSHIATITINRPEALNALNLDVLKGLEAVIDDVNKNTAIKVAIITGAGGKAFVAGADIETMIKMTPGEAAAFSTNGQQVFNKISALPQIVIAAIDGFALGGGCELALACDIRIASTKSKLGIPETGLGVIPGFGGTQRLPRLVGLPIAIELMVTARQMPADECLKCGLVNHIVPSEEIISFCWDLAEKIVKNSSSAIKLGKMAMYNGSEMDMENALAYESSMFALSFATPDQREGMEAFLAKRKPVFS